MDGGCILEMVSSYLKNPTQRPATAEEPLAKDALHTEVRDPLAIQKGETWHENL